MDFCRPIIPHSCRRASWHDYHDRSIYLVTINKASAMPPFSSIVGVLNSHENPPRTQLTPLGEVVASKISALRHKFPFVKILRRSIMPEHVHIVVFVTQRTEYTLGDIVHYLKSECTLVYNHKDDHGNEAAVFDDRYHDRILTTGGQLRRILDYVSDNPRRRLERMVYADLYQCRVICNGCGEQFAAYGNTQLLENPDIEVVIISSHDSPDELKRKKLCWLRAIQSGGVIVSPFISQDERKVRDWAFENGGRIIYIVPNGFGERFSPKGLLHTLCGEGRLLIIAPFEHCFARKVVTREVCVKMNKLAQEIAAYSFSAR